MCRITDVQNYKITKLIQSDLEVIKLIFIFALLTDGSNLPRGGFGKCSILYEQGFFYAPTSPPFVAGYAIYETISTA